MQGSEGACQQGRVLCESTGADLGNRV